MTDKVLNDNEWVAAMDFVKASAPAEEPLPAPVEDKKKMPEAFLKYLLKKKGVKDLLTEIPSDGGFGIKVGKPQSKNVNLDEIPDDGPTAPAGGETPPASEDVDKWYARIGKPSSTGTPSGSMASADINYGKDTATAWSSLKVKTGRTKKVNYGKDTEKGWSNGPTSSATTKALPAKSPGTPNPNQTPDGLTRVDTLNKAPRSSLAKLNADEDLDNDVPDNLSLPDGSFFIANKDDLQSAIGKVKNADNTNPLSKPIYGEVKRHIARRAQALGASNMVPADWQVMMALAAEAEIARAFSDDKRQALAKTGAALPDGSYPIENMADLKNAMQAFGRADAGERPKVKAHILKRAKALDANPLYLARISALGKDAS